MGRDLSELASYMLPLAQQLLDKATAAGLDPVVIDTGRTPAQQEQKIAQGVSWVTYSKHEPQPPEMKSEALDVCPRALLTEKNWAPGSPLWQQLGEIGKELGLRWGGDWTKKDFSHFEYIHPPIDEPTIQS
jgi:hypothetical protein